MSTEGIDFERLRGAFAVVGPARLVRNALDHGLELPAHRLELGKPATGTVTIATYARGGSVFLEVADDGRGLDRARILAVARARGLVEPGGMGATILGDGKVALIIDAHGVAGATGLRDPGDAVRVARSIGSNLS